MAFKKGLHIFCWDQADLLTKRRELPPDVMGAGTGFHVGKPALHLSDIVRKERTLYSWAANSARAAICSTVPSGQAPKPLSGAPKAPGLTAKARIGADGSDRADEATAKARS